MKRSGKKILSKPIIQDKKSLQFGPWDQPHQTLLNQQEIPSYRKQIVQNYLNNHSLNTRINTVEDNVNNESKNSQGNTKFNNGGQKKRGSTNFGRHSTEKKQDQNQQEQKIFLDFLLNRRKSQIKVHVVNVGNQLFLAKNQVKKDRVLSNLQEKKKFSQKLKQRKQLANIKNQCKKQNKKEPKSLKNIFMNSHLQYISNSLENTPKSIKKTEKPVYCRLSSQQKRSSSVIERNRSKIASFFN